MDLVAGVRKEGSRGGRDAFKWEDVKDDQHRENYLGHSLMARTSPHFSEMHPSVDGKETKTSHGTPKATSRKQPPMPPTPAQRKSAVSKKPNKML
ncbi:MAG: hypothetical protein Q9200_007411 [Gallowayella weberi]